MRFTSAEHFGLYWPASRFDCRITTRHLHKATRLPCVRGLDWDAIVLFANHDHRVVFLTAAMVAVPFAAFYPYSPSQLKDLGFDRVASWMSIGQVSEVMALLLIGRIQFRWKFHWIVSAGIGFGVLRYLLYSTNSSTFVILGIACHGLAFTFTHISSQVYLAERIDAQWRTRAQALLSLMTGASETYLATLLAEPGSPFARTAIQSIGDSIGEDSA